MPEDNQQKKKNNKKKNKKKDEEKVSEPELDLRSELDDGPWEEVKDTKKEKFIARQTKKKAAEAAKLAEERGEPAPSAQSEKKSESKKSEKKTKSEAGGKKQQSQQPKQQKKQPAKQPAVKKPSTEAELVAFIKQILEDTPQRYLHVPALGDRIQALTKLAWNKTFKPQHGSLKDFVSSRAEFIVDSVLERVSLKSHAQQQAAPAAKAPENKKAAKKEKKAAKQQRRQSEDDATEVQETSSNSTGLIAIGLFCVLLAGTAFVVLNKQ